MSYRSDVSDFLSFVARGNALCCHRLGSDMRTYRAALVGCGRMGAWIDNEVVGGTTVLPYSHAAGYEACDRTELIAGSDMRPEILVKFGERYGVAPEHHYTDYQEMIVTERPDILSIATQPQDRAE